MQHMRIAARMMLEFEVSFADGMPFVTKPSRALANSPKVIRVDMVLVLAVNILVPLIVEILIISLRHESFRQ